MTDRTPAIIACMRDMVAERCEKTSYNEENINLFASLDALALAVDSARTFELWPIVGDDESHAAWIIRLVIGTHDAPCDDADRVVAGAVARRLSEVACALYAQNGDVQTMSWLYRAAGRLINTANPCQPTSETPGDAAVIAMLQRKAAMLDATMARFVCLSRPTRDFVGTALGIWPEDKQ